MKKFQKTVENFTCENCGKFVEGNGFTNHCPHCLYSKHVDINPGDRSCSCGGLMKPVSLLQRHGNILVLQECIKCHFSRKNKTCDLDNLSELIKLL
ncbi:MAG: RNHCP domain-containing protein [Rickettsiales bacterium]|nr:RNHCP domain-containing protein [Rickettsiales bacterium]